MMKRIFIITFFLFFLPFGAFADVPVIDMSSDSSLNSDTENRIKQLEEQVNYLKNNITRTDELQQQVQALQGQLEEERHTVDRLSSSQNNKNNPVINYENTANNNAQANFTTKNNSTLAATDANEEKNLTGAIQEQQAYQNAFKLVQAQQYKKAIAALNSYLNQYPNGKYTARTYYWLGQLFMVTGQNDKAVNNFTTVIDNYANSAKAPNAMLTLGSIEYTQSNWTQARTWWQKIIKKYPASSASKIAANYINNLDKDGH